MTALLIRFLPHILVVLAVVGGAVVAYQYVDNNWATDAGIAEGERRVQAQWDQAVAKQRAAEQEKVDVASTKKEAGDAKAKVKFKIITRDVDRVVIRDVYKNICFDEDGLRAANSALVGDGYRDGEER